MCYCGMRYRVDEIRKYLLCPSKVLYKSVVFEKRSNEASADFKSLRTEPVLSLFNCYRRFLFHGEEFNGSTFFLTAWIALKVMNFFE